MATINRRLKEVIDLAWRAGAAFVDTTPEIKRHICIKVHAENGQQRKFFTSRTPSDWRANLNLTGEIRRFCRTNKGMSA